MQKAFEKIVERLEEAHINCYKPGDYKYNKAIDKALEIVNQVAEEYKTDIEFAEKCVELAEK